MLDTTQLEEQRKLIERAKHDPAAFGEIFDAYYPAILNYIVRRIGDVAVAEDLASATFLKAMRGIGRFTWQGVPISAWLYRIAGNEIRMHYRRGKRTVSLGELREQGGYELVDEADLSEELQAAQDIIDRQFEAQRVRAHILTLPLKYQEVLALRFGEDKKIAEIALILGKKEGTVKSLLSRALARLRKSAGVETAQPFYRRSIMNSEGVKPQEEYER